MNLSPTDQAARAIMFIAGVGLITSIVRLGVRPYRHGADAAAPTAAA